VPGEDRSQKATPKRRQDARKRGQVVRSRELTGALGLLGVVLLLGWQAGFAAESWRRLFFQMIYESNWSQPPLIQRISSTMTEMLVHSLAVPLALLWTISLAASVAQGGVVFSADPLLPQFSRLNPVTNLGNLFSAAGFARMLKSFVPVAIILYLATGITQRDWMMIETSSRADVRPLLGWVAGRVYELGWKCGLVLLAWSIADYFFQRRQLESSLMMSREDVRQETKDSEASPLVRGQIRRRRRELRKRWTLKDVERATAVVVNPQHFAVALEYRQQTMAAPVVIAKGMDDLALRIKEAARWHGIPIVENPPLAQALYRSTEVGEAIPAKLYTAVAEILAFLYRAQASLRASLQNASAGGASPGMRN
jgi:flagellar biosynthetic protein FlhB